MGNYDAWKTSEPAEREPEQPTLYYCRECAFSGTGADAFRHHMASGHSELQIGRSSLVAVWSDKAVA